MIHFALPTRRTRAAAPAVLPLQPNQYLELRRTAAGLSYEQVAAKVAAVARRADIMALLDMLETPGVRAKKRETVELFAAAFPLSVEVYFQLAELPPAEHPRVCRGCGCSHWDPCTDGHGNETCSWTDNHQCSRCAKKAS